MNNKSHEIKNLENLLSRLPGFGPKSARRALLYMLSKRDSFMLPLRDAISEAIAKVKECNVCGNIDVTVPCAHCQDKSRDNSLICVVENVSDLWALHKIDSYKGKFHVLGGLLSALEGFGPESLNIEKLINRINSDEIKEIILALPLTIDGQTTVHYLIDRLKKYSVSITQISQGVPVGGELDYLDDGTISTALNSRRPLY